MHWLFPAVFVYPSDCADVDDVSAVARNAAYFSVSPASFTDCHAVVTPLTVSAPAATTSVRPPHNRDPAADVGVMLIVYAVVFATAADAPRHVAAGFAPVSTLTHSELPSPDAFTAGVHVTVRAAGDAPASVTQTEHSPSPPDRFSTVHDELMESVTVPVMAPEPAVFPTHPTARISEFAAGVKLADGRAAFAVLVTAAGADASSAIATRHRPFAQVRAYSLQIRS
jgi:hypothetical protein